jgi:hypothetical protein
LNSDTRRLSYLVRKLTLLDAAGIAISFRGR